MRASTDSCAEPKKQPTQFFQMHLTEFSNRVMIRMLVRRQVAEGHLLIRRLLYVS